MDGELTGAKRRSGVAICFCRCLFLAACYCLFLILERNKLIGMLHGLKKLQVFWVFFPLQTHAKSQVMKGLQLRDRIPLSFVLLRLLFTETALVLFWLPIPLILRYCLPS